MTGEEWYDISFRIEPDATLRDFAAILNGLSALDVSIDYCSMEFTKDGAFFEGDHPDSQWDAIVKWCEKTEGIEIDWDLMAEWFNDQEAER